MNHVSISVQVWCGPQQSRAGPYQPLVVRVARRPQASEDISVILCIVCGSSSLPAAARALARSPPRSGLQLYSVGSVHVQIADRQIGQNRKQKDISFLSSSGLCELPHCALATRASRLPVTF